MKEDLGIPFVHNHYYTGKLLTADGLTAEQEYGSGKRRLLSLLGLGDGVLCGLTVSRPDPDTLLVDAGVALDGQGRELVLPSPVTLQISGLDGYDAAASCQHLCLAYDERPEDSAVALAENGEMNETYETAVESVRFSLTGCPPLTVADKESSHLRELTAQWERKRRDFYGTALPARLRGHQPVYLASLSHGNVIPSEQYAASALFLADSQRFLLGAIEALAGQVKSLQKEVAELTAMAHHHTTPTPPVPPKPPTPPPGPPKIVIHPDVVHLPLRGQKRFTACVSGLSDGEVIWSVREPMGGQIDNEGLYTAPRIAGVFEISAQSVARPALRASAFVSVNN